MALALITRTKLMTDWASPTAVPMLKSACSRPTRYTKVLITSPDLHNRAVLHYIRLFEADARHAADCQDQHNRDGILDTGNGDGRHHAETGAAVHARRFIDFLINSRHGGKIDDRVPSDALPDAYDEVGEDPPGLVRQEGNRLSSKGFDHRIDQSGRCEELIHHAADYGPGNKVRQVDDGLHSFFKERMVDLIQEQSQDDGKREADHQSQDVQDHRISYGTPEGIRLRHPLEKLQPHPGAVPDPLKYVVVLKRDHHARHGAVAKQKVV